MAIAFASYDEPQAWLLRGLVEYGWADVSLLRGQVPPGLFGGIDLSVWLDQDGRDGVLLRIPAVSGGQACAEDGVYRFTAQLQRRQGGLAVVVRCPEANFFQEFPFDPYNPTWAAGYVHQALASYVPAFVAWRLAGGELSWSQREGVPSVQGEPCSAGLLNYLRGRMRAHQALDQLFGEGWAVGRPGQMGASGAPLPNVVGGNAIGIVTGLGGADPSYMSAEARAALARGESPTGGPPSDAVQARARVAGPANALMTTSALAALQAIFWLVDSFTVVAYYPDSTAALLFSLPMFLILLPLSVASAVGAHQMKQLREGPLPWVAVATAALTPVCCVFGLPVAVWAFRSWTDPMVVSMRVRPNDARGGPSSGSGGGQRMSGPVAGPSKSNAARDKIGKLHEMTKKLPF